MASVNIGTNADNIVEFRPQGVRRVHGLDTALTDYLADMNAAMVAAAGISYTNVRESLHGKGFDAVRSYMDAEAPASDAVAEIIRDHRLLMVGDGVTIEQAAAYNKIQAAISEYIATDDRWHRTADGRIVSQVDGGVAFMMPVKKKQTDGPNEPVSYGFGIVVRPGLEYDTAEQRVLGRMSEAPHPIGSFDLADALDALEAHVAERKNTQSFSF